MYVWKMWCVSVYCKRVCSMVVDLGFKYDVERWAWCVCGWNSTPSTQDRESVLSVVQ